MYSFLKIFAKKLHKISNICIGSHLCMVIQIYFDSGCNLQK